MDFITKLLKSKDLATNDDFDAILVIVNRFTKHSYIILFKKSYITKQLKYVVLNRLIKYYRLLTGIISDRNKLFTLNY